MYQHVLQLHTNMHDSGHLETLNTMYNLVYPIRSQGKLHKAESQLIPVIDLQKGVLKAQHPDTLDSLSAFVVTFQAQRKYDQAVAIHQQVPNYGQKFLELSNLIP